MLDSTGIAARDHSACYENDHGPEIPATSETVSRGTESAWSSLAVETLRTLWARGESARSIAIGLAPILPGVTRNAVIGKVHRLGLPSRPSPIRSAAPPGHRGPPALKDLTEGMCRWPIGHPGIAGFHFCGCAQTAGSSYCAAHRAIAYPVRTPKAAAPGTVPLGRTARSHLISNFAR